jgi:hypothetical protein
VKATFTRCDLRATNWARRSIAGIRFVDCKFFGVHGVPIHVETVDIERPDISMVADGSRVISALDLHGRWFEAGGWA